MSARQTHSGGPRRTRMMKSQCGTCGYTIRLSRRWLSDVGPPLCPTPECNAAPLEADWEPDVGEWMERNEPTLTPRMLRDKWVETRAPHRCALCRGEFPRDEKMRHKVYSAGGELFNEYVCLTCDGTSAAGAAGARTALARA